MWLAPAWASLTGVWWGRKRKHITEEQQVVQQLLSTVLRFDLTAFKLGKTSFTRTDLAGLRDCSSLLIYEMGMECVATGLEVTVEVGGHARIPPLPSPREVFFLALC